MGLDLLCIAVLRELGSAGTRRDSADPQVPTKEGLTVELDVALLFHVRPEKIREIYREQCMYGTQLALPLMYEIKSFSKAQWMPREALLSAPTPEKNTRQNHASPRTNDLAT